MGWRELFAIAGELSGEWWQVDVAVAVGCIYTAFTLHP